MADRTGIGWTDATWNPVTGCSHVSEGCRHCYAETLSRRYGWTAKPWTARNAAENVVLHPERLDQPLRWRKPRRVFVNSMSDLFHENVPDDFIERVFVVMARSPRHTFQVLTKRPARMREMLNRSTFGATYVRNRAAAENLEADPSLRGGFDYIPDWPLPNVWLGVSVEDQRAADERIPHLLATPAAVRFLSLEPLLGPLIFPLPCNDSRFWRGIHWVIVGGESGPGYRPMEIAWLEGIVKQCREAGVPVFVKQDSGPRDGRQGRIPDSLWIQEFPR